MRQEKQLLLDEIVNDLNESSDFVLANYINLDPNLTFQLRQSVTESGGKIKIVKKRLFLKAANSMGIDLGNTKIDGHLAVLFTGNQNVSSAKSLFDFKKENNKLIDVIAGRFDGKYCSAEDLKEIASLPSHDEMRAQFIGVLEAPLSGLVSVMEASLTSVISCIEQKAESNN